MRDDDDDEGARHLKRRPMSGSIGFLNYVFNNDKRDVLFLL